MTGDLYKDVDVPFCCHCSRFMVKDRGIIQVALNHESDTVYMVRFGRAYGCPQCGRSVIYKWLKFEWAVPAEVLKQSKNWYIFLEDHTHYNRGRGFKNF